MLTAYLQNALLALKCDCPRVAKDQLQLALALANVERPEAKRFIMRAMNYARVEIRRAKQ